MAVTRDSVLSCPCVICGQPMTWATTMFDHNRLDWVHSVGTDCWLKAIRYREDHNVRHGQSGKGG